MALSFCTTCNRKQYHFLKDSCTGHSDWPPKSKPREINIVIPAYKPEAKVVAVSNKIKLTDRDRKRVKDRLANLDAVELDDVDMGPEYVPNVIVPGELRCSFCGIHVDEVDATRGKTIPKVRVKEEVTFIQTRRGLVPIVKDEMYWLSMKQVACPEHALLIGPSVDKYGDIIHQGTSFPETEG